MQDGPPQTFCLQCSQCRLKHSGNRANSNKYCLTSFYLKRISISKMYLVVNHKVFRIPRKETVTLPSHSLLMITLSKWLSLWTHSEKNNCHRIYVLKGDITATIHKKLVNVYGNAALVVRIIKRSFNRPGVKNKAQELITVDRTITIAKFCEILQGSYGSHQFSAVYWLLRYV